MITYCKAIAYYLVLPFAALAIYAKYVYQDINYRNRKESLDDFLDRW